MKETKLLSLIVPAYKQEKTITENIQSLQHAVKSLPIDTEIIVVVDGYIDKTYELLKKNNFSKVKVVGYKENRGKGFAIKTGVEKAKGDIIGFIDSGMDIDPEGINMLIQHMLWYDADIIVGSKMHPVSQVNYPLWRKILSWGYRTLTLILFGYKVRDTQVGLKVFKRNVAKEVFPHLLVDRFAFDIEILAVAYSLGYKRIFEAPIRLNFNPAESSITKRNFWRTVLFMLLDTLGVFYRVRILRSYQRRVRE